MHISEYASKTFIEELAIFLKCSKTFEKLLQPVIFLKMLLFQRYLFLYHILRTVPKDFRSFSKNFQSIPTSHSVGTNQIHAWF